MIEPGTRPAGTGIPIWPTSRLGWASVVTTAIALALMLVLPLITAAFREVCPITDTYVMPLILAAGLVIAAVTSVLALWPGRQFTAVTIVAAAIVVPLFLFIVPIIIGEGVAGALSLN